MGLIFTGREENTINALLLLAKDARTGANVVVRVSHEAIRDHGQDACEEVADRKHSDGQVDEEGNVRVGVTDF